MSDPSVRFSARLVSDPSVRFFLSDFLTSDLHTLFLIFYSQSTSRKIVFDPSWCVTDLVICKRASCFRDEHAFDVVVP